MYVMCIYIYMIIYVNIAVSVCIGPRMFPSLGLQWDVNILINKALDFTHKHKHTNTHTHTYTHTNTNAHTHTPTLSTETKKKGAAEGRFPCSEVTIYVSQTSMNIRGPCRGYSAQESASSDLSRRA